MLCHHGSSCEALGGSNFALFRQSSVRQQYVQPEQESWIPDTQSVCQQCGEVKSRSGWNVVAYSCHPFTFVLLHGILYPLEFCHHCCPFQLRSFSLHRIYMHGVLSSPICISCSLKCLALDVILSTRILSVELSLPLQIL